jgi:putative aldouronate transport system permease protein
MSSIHRTKQLIKKYKMLYIFLLPAFIVTIIFSYIPIMGVIMAFQDFKIKLGFINSPFVGFKHFIVFLEDPAFYRALRNTLAMNGLIILIGFPLPIILALLLNELKNLLFKRIAQTVVYLPYFISWVVVAGLFYRLLDADTGQVNLFLEWIGLQKIPFFREEDYFWGIMTAAYVWKFIGWNSIIFLAALATIDLEQHEAATVDGAGRFRKLIYITLPGIAPVIGLMFIFTIATIFGGGGGGGGASFDAIYNLSNPLVMNTADTVEYYIYSNGIRMAKYSFAAAVGLALSIVSFIILITANKISKKINGYGAF